jgi:predicted metal-binding protein
MDSKIKFASHKIMKKILPSKIKKDLESYRKAALELGAANAAVIPSREIIIDERVRAKCMYPKCSNYGTNINCPPHAPELDFVRRVVAKYRWGILFSVQTDTAYFTGLGPEKVKQRNTAKVLLNRICSDVESRAFYDGYPLALAFGQGPCKTFWCPDQACAALEPGKTCRFPLKARSSMEAVGMNVFGMVARKGWEIYPMGQRADADTVAHILLVGLILIT